MKLQNLFNSLTNKLIAANVIAFILIWLGVLIFGQEKTISFIALQPVMILQGKKLWTIVTSMFSHLAFWHLFVNMISLYFVGNFVEKLIGKKRFLIFYFISGIFASLFMAVLSGLFGFSILGAKVFGNALIPSVGASGIIFGLVGILAILTPKTKIYFIAGPLIALILESILKMIFPNATTVMSIVNGLITIYFMVAIFSILSFNQKLQKIGLPVEMQMKWIPFIAIVPLIVIGLFVDLPIGNMAHLGGLIVGLIYAIYLKNKFPRKSQAIARRFG